MKTGDDNWKWALVLILAGIFILLANQAYHSIYNAQDDFPPPDDYLQGDSFDMESRKKTVTPGSGQAIDINLPDQVSPATQTENASSSSSVEHPKNIDWGKVEDPSKK
ncbi:MAG: hypothetical protein HQM08_12600 [Candidatus Riflebacteria bacterium]|nr:hypothetical protein [Candidatus Riflebacteria bacterium]